MKDELARVRTFLNHDGIFSTLRISSETVEALKAVLADRDRLHLALEQIADDYILTPAIQALSKSAK